MSTAVNANVRVLELFVELLGARPGRTKAQLRTLPGYQGLADDAFETQFQRDKDALRDAGAHMTIHSGERYSIAWDTFAPGIEVTSADRALMSLAARAWDSTESVEPWALSVQGRALYLWGWDLDRGGERTFRVSRIRSQISFLGELGDASLAPEGAEFPRVSSFVSPIVDVREGSTARTLLHGYEAGASSEELGSPRQGWEHIALEGAEVGTWIGRLLPLAADVVVVSPELLRDAMLTRLRAAATWGEADA